MYVIFPLDELLDLNSARENKRGRATLEKPSHTRHTAQVIPLSQPNQQLPNQLKPPLSKQPQTPPQQQKQITSTPPQQPQQKATPPQSQKSTLSKAPSKTSIIVTPPSAVVPPPSPLSALSSSTSSLQIGNVKKTPTTAKQTVVQPQQQPALPPLDSVHKRQRSSHSTSTETSSTSSTGKGKALLTPPAAASGGAATNRSSWSGPQSGPLQESCPTRTGSFRAFKDLAVSSDGSSLKVVELSRAESTQDIRASSLSIKSPITKSNSFRSHLSDSCAQRPRLKGVEAIRKPPTSPTSSISETPLFSPAEIPWKLQETAEQPLSQPDSKIPEAIACKEETLFNVAKEKPPLADEGVKIKQESSLSSSQLTAAESLRIQQECLAPALSPEAKAVLSNQRHPSGRSKHSSGRQKLSEIPPSGIGGGLPRGATLPAAGINSKNPGSGSLRGLQQRNTAVMASNESSFRDLTNPALNESLKAHNAFTFKLVKTGPSSVEESRSPDVTSAQEH